MTKTTALSTGHPSFIPSAVQGKREEHLRLDCVPVTLVIITGIAVSGVIDKNNLALSLDVYQDDVMHGDVFITTDYRLENRDRWKEIVNENTSLLHATTVSLAAIASDDEESPGTPTGFVFALDQVETIVDSADSNRIQIHITGGLQGDSTLMRISYQTNILVQKAVPPQKLTSSFMKQSQLNRYPGLKCVSLH